MAAINSKSSSLQRVHLELWERYDLQKKLSAVVEKNPEVEENPSLPVINQSHKSLDVRDPYSIV